MPHKVTRRLPEVRTLYQILPKGKEGARNSAASSIFSSIIRREEWARQSPCSVTRLVTSADWTASSQP